MFTDPSLGQRVRIDGREYAFVETPNAPGIIYAEIGRKAKVYQVVNTGNAFALKALKPKYRNAETVGNSDHIAKYSDVPGLAVAQRTILWPESYPELIRHYKDFAYAILMPWVEGKSWFSYVTGEIAITAQESSRLARAFINVISDLEHRGLAHCDLSNTNFIFSPTLNHVELVDIEDMYGPGLKPPTEMPRGTGGYSATWIRERGVWEAAADRFSAGILVSEILGWRFWDVRQACDGDAFFAEGEFGRKSKRFHLLSQHLEELHPELANLFKAVWFSESLEECPKVADWKVILESIQEPELEISPQLLSFDTLDLSKTSVQEPEINLRIRNSGSGILIGKLLCNVPWLKVIPDDFSCAEGAASYHKVILAPNAPITGNHTVYSFQDGITAKSNAGLKTLSGRFSVIRQKSYTWIYVLASLLTLLVFGACCFFGGLFWLGNTTSSPHVTNFRMTTDEQGQNTTLVYSPYQAFNVFFDVQGVDPGTHFEAKWYSENAVGFDSSAPLKVSDYYYEQGVSSIYFQLTYSDSWPTGTYRVEVYMDGTKVGEEKFSVR